MITVYSKENCVYCVSAKSLLDFKNLEYKTVMVPEHMPLTEFKALYPEVRTFPLIIEDGTIIGGFTELQKYMLEKEMKDLSI